MLHVDHQCAVELTQYVRTYARLDNPDETSSQFVSVTMSASVHFLASRKKKEYKLQMNSSCLCQKKGVKQ